MGGEIENELAELKKLIAELEKILADENEILRVISEELTELKNKYGDERRTIVVPNELGKFSDEELVPNEQVIVTLTNGNYIKRVAANTYKAQGRGGKGIMGMTTKEEDILTTESYIRNNIVYDKLLQSVIVHPIVARSYDDLLLGDRNALLIATRLYGHGEIYDIEVDTPSGNKQKVSVDLNDLKPKELENLELYKNENRFNFKLPIAGNNIEFKLMTVGDDKAVTKKLKTYKSSSGRDTQLSDRLKSMIISVDGNDDPNFKNLFVEGMLARDVKAFRKYIADIQPNIDMEIEVVDEATGEPFPHSVTLDASFFWSNT